MDSLTGGVDVYQIRVRKRRERHQEVEKYNFLRQGFIPVPLFASGSGSLIFAQWIVGVKKEYHEVDLRVIGEYTEIIRRLSNKDHFHGG